MTAFNADDVRKIIDDRLAKFEDRLAIQFEKALDVVTASQEQRLKDLESDVAKLQRHLGLDKRGRS